MMKDKNKLIIIILLYAVSVAASVFIFPTENQFEYSYDKGAQWLYDDLYAPYDFAICRSQEDVQADLENRVGLFALPAVDEKWGTPVLGGGDQFVKFSDKEGVDAFLEFLTTWEACAPWARIGGALFPHKTQNFDDYGNSLERDIAKILVNATVFRFDASDLMPAEVGAGTFWTGMLNYVSGDTDVAKTLKTIDASWPKK